jgi:hypothetical protein
VELNGKEVYTNRLRTADPKFAIRLGCADADLVSQFIAMEEKKQKRGQTDRSQSLGDEQDFAQQDAPAEPEVTEKKASLEHRARAAWADLLRQVGMNFIPQHSLGSEAIPEGLSQVAFWIIRRNADGLLKKPQFTPIAILAAPGQPTVMGRMPGQDWMPYPRGRGEIRKRPKALGGRLRPGDAGQADRHASRDHGLRAERTQPMGLPGRRPHRPGQDPVRRRPGPTDSRPPRAAAHPGPGWPARGDAPVVGAER